MIDQGPEGDQDQTQSWSGPDSGAIFNNFQNHLEVPNQEPSSEWRELPWTIQLLEYQIWVEGGLIWWTNSFLPPDAGKFMTAVTAMPLDTDREVLRN